MSALVSISDGSAIVTPKLAVIDSVSSFHDDRHLGQLAAQRVGDALGAFDRRLGQQDEELLAAVAAFHVAAAQHVAHARADGRQHRVAAQVAVAIVDVLEVIEVEHDERDRHLRAPRAAQLGVDHLERVRAVEAAGQAVAQAVLAHLAEELRVAQRDAEQRRRRRERALPPFAERPGRFRHAEHADRDRRRPSSAGRGVLRRRPDTRPPPAPSAPIARSAICSARRARGRGRRAPCRRAPASGRPRAAAPTPRRCRRASAGAAATTSRMASTSSERPSAWPNVTSRSISVGARLRLPGVRLGGRRVGLRFLPLRTAGGTRTRRSG